MATHNSNGLHTPTNHGKKTASSPKSPGNASSSADSRSRLSKQATSPVPLSGTGASHPRSLLDDYDYEEDELHISVHSPSVGRGGGGSIDGGSVEEEDDDDEEQDEEEEDDSSVESEDLVTIAEVGTTRIVSKAPKSKKKLPGGRMRSSSGVSLGGAAATGGAPTKQAKGAAHGHSLSRSNTLQSAVQLYMMGWVGYSEQGFLPDARSHMFSPVQMTVGPPPDRIIQIAQGEMHTLLLTDDGLIYSFGSGEYGRLGHGSSQNEPYPRVIQRLKNKRVVQIGCGGRHSAAVTADGLLFTWGDGSMGQLGQGKGTESCYYPKMVSDPFFKEGKFVTRVACGSAHTLVVVSGSTVYAFGSNSSSQLGIPLRSAHSISASSSSALAGGSSSVSGPSSSALAAGGDGRGGTGSGLGISSHGSGLGGSKASHHGAGAAGLASTAGGGAGIGVSASSTSASSAAVAAATASSTFQFDPLASNSSQQPLVSVCVYIAKLVKWPRNKRVLSVSAGDEHSAIVDHDGVLYTFGSSIYGQTMSNFIDRDYPAPVLVVRPQLSAIRAALEEHALRVAAFQNGDGRLNSGRLTPIGPAYRAESFSVQDSLARFLAANAYANPAAEGPGSNGIGLGANSDDNLVRFVSVHCGYMHTLVVSDQGHVYVAGLNSSGQLGLGHTLNVGIPSLMTSLVHERVVDAGAGFKHSVLLTESRMAYVCGDCEYGQTGQGPPEFKRIPARAPDGTGSGMVGIEGGLGIAESFDRPNFQAVPLLTPSPVPAIAHLSAKTISAGCFQTFLLCDLLSLKERDKLIALFHSLDSAGEGTLSEHELGELFARLGRPLLKSERRLLMKTLDDDSNGFVTMHEFMQHYLALLNLLDQLDVAAGRLPSSSKIVLSSQGLGGSTGTDR